MRRPQTGQRWRAAGGLAGGVIALALAGCGSGGTTTTVYQSSAIPTSLSQSSKALSVNQIYKKDSPGVVDIKITATTNVPGFGLFGGGGGQQQEQGEGAGVIYDTNGDILTDEHVVSGANSVKVTFQDGQTTPAKVVGTDPSTDVAVIHVDVPSSQLHPIPLADSAAAEVGDPVVAIGSPFQLPETTTAGIVSQVGRDITAPNQYTITGAIQTDAAINPGNSGGPLLDASGRVLGLVDQIETNNTGPSGQGSSSGVGFAVPANTVARIASAFIAGHPVKHAYVGVSLAPSSTGGAQIASVKPGGPASNAGIQAGEMITAINGKPVTTTEQFISGIDNLNPGDAVTLTVKRGSQSRQVQVTLGTRPSANPTGG